MFKALFSALIATALWVPQLSAQGFSLDSYQRARRVLDASLAAMGGLERVRGINSVIVRHEGRGF